MPESFEFTAAPTPTPEQGGTFADTIIHSGTTSVTAEVANSTAKQKKTVLKLIRTHMEHEGKDLTTEMISLLEQVDEKSMPEVMEPMIAPVQPFLHKTREQINAILVGKIFSSVMTVLTQRYVNSFPQVPAPEIDDLVVATHQRIIENSCGAIYMLFRFKDELTHQRERLRMAQ